MTIYVVLAQPILNANSETGEKPAVSWPGQVHLTGGGVARPCPTNGNILVSQDDARGLIANGWITQCSGDETFLAGLLSSGWKATANGGFDGSAAGGS